MSNYTLASARDAIIAHFTYEWTNTLGLSPSNILHQNRDPETVGNSDDIWCRFYMYNTAFNKSSLGNINGVSQYDRNSLIIIQVMTPLDDGIDDVTIQGVLDIFEGGVSSLSGIYFRDVTPNEIGANGNSYQTNVTAQVLYNQVK